MGPIHLLVGGRIAFAVELVMEGVLLWMGWLGEQIVTLAQELGSPLKCHFLM